MVLAAVTVHHFFLSRARDGREHERDTLTFLPSTDHIPVNLFTGLGFHGRRRGMEASDLGKDVARNRNKQILLGNMYLSNVLQCPKTTVNGPLNVGPFVCLVDP